MATNSQTGPMVYVIAFTVGGIFLAWLCNFVFKPYIHRALSYCFKMRVGGVLNVIDIQEWVLINRLTGPPKRIIDPETGQFKYISPPFSIHKIQPIGEDEKKEEEKNHEEKMTALPIIETKRKNISPRKIKQMIRAKEVAEKLQTAIKKANYVPTTAEKIAQGKYNFKRHFLYHKAPMGWYVLTHLHSYTHLHQFTYLPAQATDRRAIFGHRRKCKKKFVSTKASRTIFTLIKS